MATDDSDYVPLASVQPVFITINVLFYIAVACGSFVFWRRRKVHPIRGRGPFVSLTTNVVLALVSSMHLIHLLNASSYPCTLWIWQIAALHAGIFICYVVRCLKLIITYHTTMEQLSIGPFATFSHSSNLSATPTHRLSLQDPNLSRGTSQRSRDGGRAVLANTKLKYNIQPHRHSDTPPNRASVADAEAPPKAPATSGSAVVVDLATVGARKSFYERESTSELGWYTAHKHWLLHYGLKLVAITLLLLLLIPSVVTTIWTPAGRRVGICADVRAMYGFMATLAVFVSVFAALVYRMRKIRESFTIKRELAYSGLSAVLFPQNPKTPYIVSDVGGIIMIIM